MLKYGKTKVAKAPSVTAPDKPRRTRHAVLGTQVQVRLQPEHLAKVDARRGKRSRADVIRDMITKA